MISSSLMELHDLMSLNLSYNSFKDSQIPEFFGSLRNLRYLSLFDCGFKGNIPSQLGSLSQLRYLDLGSNNLEGSIPYQLGNLSNLQLLNLERNNFVGAIPHQLGNLSKLQELYLGDIVSLKTDKENGVGGEWLSSLTSLTLLSLRNISDLKYSHNWLQIIGKLPSLQMLSLSSNNLSDHYILLLTPFEFNSSNSLSVFYLGGNSFTSSVIFHWLMNFNPNLVTLDLESNFLKGNICTLQSLALFNNHLSEDLPTILQSFLGCAKYSLQELDLSINQITGTIPRDLQFPSQLVTLFISFNSLKGVLTESHFANMPNLKHLDISNNSLALRFNHNWIPPFQLESIYVRSCKLGPSFPKWLKTQNDLTSLDMSEAGIVDMVPEWFWINILTPNLKELDVSYNNLRGPIPSWIGIELRQLKVLSLRNNQFLGSLSLHLCNLTSIQFLDLSLNNLGVEQIFKNTRLLLKGIDLSNNQLVGEIPAELGTLVELVSLNLSRNNLIGKIPSEIGQLRLLEFLDLSRNHFFGPIPSSLAQIDRLTMLDLSHNNLSGKIPIGTQLQSFDASSYEENLNLCGKPLEKKCPEEEESHKHQAKFEEDEDSLFSKGFYWSMALGFITGFWGVFGTILFNRSWRHAYFRFLSNVADTIYVNMIVNATKCKRWLKG
ncbi:receptor-like protein EIX1 [Senna tora]|uniref:Receptor-like protein EIX1 n=1 Tax=Senna tora TaxID=362788 RepID=A0A834T0J2_9FABA|nr:receptor-like protein EIX1 [Senna tora]